jgi:hypothetical protein
MFFLLQLLLISSLNNFLSCRESLLPSLSPQVGRDFRVNYGGLRDFIVTEMYTDKKVGWEGCILYICLRK